MAHSLVKLVSTPQQIPDATQGLLHFEGSMDQYSTGANRVFPFSTTMTLLAMYHYFHCRQKSEGIPKRYSSLECQLFDLYCV
jgi:hypothetical protein